MILKMATPALNQLYEAVHEYNKKWHNYTITHAWSNRYWLQNTEGVLIIGNISFLLGYIKWLNDGERNIK